MCAYQYAHAHACLYTSMHMHMHVCTTISVHAVITGIYSHCRKMIDVILSG